MPEGRASRGWGWLLHDIGLRLTLPNLTGKDQGWCGVNPWGWLLHDIVITNRVWCMAYKRGVEEVWCTAQ